MTSIAILSHRPLLGQRRPLFPWFSSRLQVPSIRCPLVLPHEALPRFVRECPVAMRYHRLLTSLAWCDFPERDLTRNYGAQTVPFAPFIAACLVKLDQQKKHMSQLREYLVEHPALAWLLGFPLHPFRGSPAASQVDASLPTVRHFTRMLRQVPNASLQFLLDEAVRLLQAELAPVFNTFGQSISLDTKHILAWVQENNPKAYLKRSERYNKQKQPRGDPDCRLGCKRRHNQRAPHEPPPTPSGNPLPGRTISIGEYYWGYGSGVVATKVPGWGEFVLAELTQPFDQPDVSYFQPLMADVERRLGFHPRYGAFDAAFDAFYVYEYFHQQGQNWRAGFAATPFAERGGHRKQFSEQGLPLCQAGLAMPRKYVFIARTSLVPHERARYVCPLRFPVTTGDSCPISHKQWPKGGCTTTLATSVGARLRYEIDRESEAYKLVYRQRTATERINSQAVELGIERPKLRNGRAIANQNTLIYVLINLRALQRIRRQKDSRSTCQPAQ